MCKPTNPESTLPPPPPHTHTFFVRLSHSGPLFPGHITPGPDTQQLGTVPVPQSLLQLFKLAKPTPPRPFLPRETTRKALAPCVTLMLTHMALLHGMPRVSRAL